MAWTNMEGHVHNLTCPNNGLSSRCPPFSEIEQGFAFFGELFIGANFTAIALALKKDTSLGDQFIHPEFLLVRLGIDDYTPSGINIDLPANAFPLYRNVQLRATLAMTHRQTSKNKNIAALGLQKVGCDVQKIIQHR